MKNTSPIYNLRIEVLTRGFIVSRVSTGKSPSGGFMMSTYDFTFFLINVLRTIPVCQISLHSTHPTYISGLKILSALRNT